MSGLPLVASTVHDVKNLLAGLEARLGRLCTAAPRAAGDDLLLVRRGVLAAGHKLTMLLALLRAQEGTLRLATVETDLQEFVDDLRVEADTWRDPAMRFDTAFDADVPAAWEFDRFMAGQVVTNALQNAYRHTRTRVEMALSMAADGRLAIEVVDDGPGFAPDTLRAFEEDCPLPMHGVGSGMGLALALAVARAHGRGARSGAVSLSNCPAGGARFSLLLP